MPGPGGTAPGPALGVVGEGLVELGLEAEPARGVVLGFGGDAPNAAVMAARLGCEARLAGRVGDDALGRRLLAFWREAGRKRWFTADQAKEYRLVDQVIASAREAADDGRPARQKD